MAGSSIQEGVVRVPATAPGGPRTPRSESALIKAARRGDPDAAGELARRYWDESHHAAFLIVRDAQAAEDVAQESILKALGKLDGFDRRRPFRPWLHRIVANRSIDWLRANDRLNETEIDDADLVSDPPSPQEALGAVGPALAKLDAKTRAIVVLRCLFDYRAREIARMLDTSAGAVRTRLHRGLRELRDRLDEELE